MASVPAAAPRTFDRHGAVRLWLLVVTTMVAATAVVGAATRLTGSGLSITEWAPILGIMPPLSDADWQVAFDRYKAIPQYAQLNKGMSLAAFKTIYWWEWSHRLIARSIGIVFAIPFVAFLIRGAIPRALVWRLVGIFLLGGLQGFVGWYMVRSGLVDRVDVSQYRLALHLGIAFVIFGLIVWTLLDLAPRTDAAPSLDTITTRQRRTASVILGLTFAQVLLGALVAGLKAGRTFNTWPLMDGGLVPAGLFQLAPWWLNAFENAATVQFNHRLLAYALVAVALIHAAGIIRGADDPRARRTARLLAATIIAQTALGIWTLLAWVPLGLGIAHQIGALVVVAAAIAHRHALARRVA
jgi:heme a synthase